MLTTTVLVCAVASLCYLALPQAFACVLIFMSGGDDDQG